MNQTNVIGKTRANADLQTLSMNDAFKDTDIYGVSTKLDAEKPWMKRWEIGQTLAANLRVIKTVGEGTKDERTYAGFETDDGLKFRAYLPGQLEHNLKALPLGSYVELTYNGKEDVVYKDGSTQATHQFLVKHSAPTSNKH